MAGLARAKQVEEFNEKTFIKGFSTMLALAKCDDGLLYWHLFYKEGSRISYLDGKVGQEQNIRRMDLESCRHILGWCSEARFYAGKNNVHLGNLPRFPLFLLLI